MEDIEKRGLPLWLTAYLNYKLGVVNSIPEELYKEVPNDLKECIDCIAEGKEVPNPSILASYPIYFKEEIIEEVEEHGGSKCETPVASPAGGTYDSKQTVTLTCATDGATIYYTTDGSDPTSESTEYTSAITVSSNTTIKAIAIKEDFDDSDVMSAEYEITVVVTKVANPVASPTAGSYDSAQTVTLTCATDGATIYYTTDGSTPTSSSTEYTSAITISSDTVLKAIAVKEDFDDSDIISASYEIVDYDTVAFADLDTYLKGKEANTTATPYKIKITGLTGENCFDEDEWESPLGNILKDNSTKYVDLSPTTIIPINDGNDVYLYEIFYECTSLIVAPKIPDNIQNLRLYNTFEGCSNLTVAPLIPENVAYMSCTFRYCTSLTSVVIAAQGENGEIYPGDGHEDEYIFAGCTNLQHIYGTTAEVCCKLIKGFEDAGQTSDITKIEPLNGYVDRGPASVLPEVTPDYTVEFSGLDTLLQGLEANTVATPYKIKVTGLTGEDCYDNVNYGTSPLGLVLQNNSTKYVDLSPTTIVPYETQYHSLTLDRAFEDCTSLVVAPYVPVTTNDAFEMFKGCSSLKSATIYLTNDGTSNKYLYAGDIFYNAPLESVRFISPTTYLYSGNIELAMVVDSDYVFIDPTTNLNAIYVDTYEAKLALYKWASEKVYGDWSYITIDNIIVDPITNS